MVEYNTIVGKGDYTIKFHTDNREWYKEIEEHIRQLIDESVVEKEEKSYLSEQQNEEIAQKTIEKMKKVYKISGLKIYPENIGIFGEKIKSNEEQFEKLKKDVSDLQAMVNLLQSCIHKLEIKSVQI